MSNNLKDKIKRDRMCSLNFTPSSKFEGLHCKENVDSFFGFFAFFLLIFSFFFFLCFNLRLIWISLLYFWNTFFFLSFLLQFYFKYSIDFYVFYLFFLWFLSPGSPLFHVIFFSFYSLKMVGGWETIYGFEDSF